MNQTTRLRVYILAFMLIFAASTLAHAIDFTPKADINLQSRYNLTKGVNSYFDKYFGDGSALTGISGSGDASINVTASCIVAKDGSGDSTTVQGCFDKLNGTGGRVFIRHGIYSENTFRIPVVKSDGGSTYNVDADKWHIECEDIRTVLNNTNELGEAALALSNTAGTRWGGTIKNCFITDGGSGGAGLLMDGMHFWRIEDLYISAVTGDGIKISDSCLVPYVENVHIATSGGNGIYIGGDSNAKMKGAVFVGGQIVTSQLSGLNVTGADINGNAFLGTHFENNGGGGVSGSGLWNIYIQDTNATYNRQVDFHGCRIECNAEGGAYIGLLVKSEWLGGWTPGGSCSVVMADRTSKRLIQNRQDSMIGENILANTFRLKSSAGSASKIQFDYGGDPNSYGYFGFTSGVGGFQIGAINASWQAILPALGDAYDLGSNSRDWDNIYYSGALTDTSPNLIEKYLEQTGKKPLDILIKRDKNTIAYNQDLQDSDICNWDENKTLTGCDMGEIALLSSLQISEAAGYLGGSNSNELSGLIGGLVALLGVGGYEKFKKVKK